MNNNGPHYESPSTEVIPLPEDEVQKIEDARIKDLEEANINESAVIAEIHENMGSWQAYFQENNTKGKEDLEFLYRDQWTSVERSEFQRIFKPAMVVNKLSDPVRKIIGEYEENTPEIKVRSLTGKASDEDVQLHSDMLRRIAYSSDSMEAYQAALKSSLTFSYSSLFVDIEYQSSDSFDQEIIIKCKLEPEKCFWDPKATKIHKCDGDFCGFYLAMSHDSYDSKYPNVPHPVSFSDPQTLTQFQWYTPDSIVICEYWVKEYYTKILYELGSGEVVTAEEYEKLKKMHKKATKHVSSLIPEDFIDNSDEFVGELIPPMLEIVRNRVADDYRIMHYRCTGDKVLEFEEWPSKILPLIFVAGDIYYEQGQQYTTTFISQAKDTQRTINYLASEIAGQIKNMSRGQWLGTPGNIKGPGMELQWQNPEIQMGMLVANPDPITKAMPAKIPAAEISQSLFIHYERVSRDLKEVTGMYDTQLGDQGNEDSGKAIDNRALQGASSPQVYFSNMRKAIVQANKAALDLFPAVYDNQRTLTLTRPSGDQYTVTINQKGQDGSIKNEIRSGDFDIEVIAGPSFAVQKRQAVDILVQIVSANPQIFPLVADLLAKNLDVEFSQQLVDRFKTIVPPEILAKEEGKEPPPPQPKPEEILMQKQMELADAKLNEQEHELHIREQKLELDKAKMLLQLQELQHKMRSMEAQEEGENNRAILDYSAQIAKIIASVSKGSSVE